MLHTIAAGTRDVYQQQISYFAQAHEAGFTFQPGAVLGLDRAARKVELAATALPDGRVLFPARSIDYDVLVFAVGSRANDFHTPGVDRYCLTIDSRIQANRFNEDLRVAMIRSGSEGMVNIAIVGGGATGVELSAELVQLARAAETYAKVDFTARVKITLIESAPRLLGAFPEQIAKAVQARLGQLGVDVRTGLQIASAEEGGFRTREGELIEAQLMVWSAGVKAPDFLASLDGLETTRNNELVVTPRLQTSRDPAIFAVGDCASLILPGTDRRLPPTAQVAHQQAKYLVDHLPSWRQSKSIPDFRYTDFGSLVSLAEYDGYGSLGSFGIFKGGFIRGRLAQLSHALLYRAHQSRILGFWRGGLVWAVDQINGRVRPRIRLG